MTAPPFSSCIECLFFLARGQIIACLLYTSDAAHEEDSVDLGGRRIIKKNVIASSKGQTPGLGNMPVIGNLFKGTSKSDNLDELLVFIAPRIL